MDRESTQPLAESVAQDPKFLRLLQDVGAKLHQLDLKAKGQLDQKDDLQQVDPIAKVENWRQEPNLEEDDEEVVVSSAANAGAVGVLTNGGVTSCYESLAHLTTTTASSPSPPALLERGQTLIKGHEQVTPSGDGPNSPPAEFDSGYPGSDRSVANSRRHYYSLKGMSPLASAKNANSSKESPLRTPPNRSLFNLSEEDKSQQLLCQKTSPTRPKKAGEKEGQESSSSSLPSDFQPLASSEHKLSAKVSKPLPKLMLNSSSNIPKSSSPMVKQGSNPAPVANLLRVHVHSVTDLSSDEHSMFEKENAIKDLNTPKEDKSVSLATSTSFNISSMVLKDQDKSLGSNKKSKTTF